MITGTGRDTRPVPCIGIDVGEVGALLSIVTFPEDEPGLVERKITSNVPCVFCVRVPGILGEGLMMANGSWVAMSEITRSAVPVFDIVT